jgi:cytochrome c oxidase subunit 4
MNEISKFLLIGLLLMALLAITVGVSFIDLHFFSLFIALAIAGAKTYLVLVYFMEIKRNSHATWVAAGAGVFWLAILIVLMMSDYISRGWLSAAEGTIR